MSKRILLAAVALVAVAATVLMLAGGAAADTSMPATLRAVFDVLPGGGTPLAVVGWCVAAWNYASAAGVFG